MALLARQDASGLGGKAITFSAASASDTAVGGQSVHLLVNNTSGATRTVTVVTPETVEGGLTVQDRAISVATATIFEVPIPSRYNDTTTGLATITIDNATGVTYAVVQGSATP
jgi:hypothetical protein